MIIDKILNNNAVCSMEEGKEIILVGLGIGWHAHVGDEVDMSKVQKTFLIL